VTSQQGQILTLWFCIGLSVLVAAYEHWAIATFGLDCSISRTLADLFRRRPTAAAVFLVWVGILIGHILPAR
jgi:hypothetical protein